MKYILLLILFSCQKLPVHEQNLVEQNKTMLKYDEQSRKKQQKIRDSRKKRMKIKTYKSKNLKKII